MAHYQLRRPSPVNVIPRHVRRGTPVASTMPAPKDDGKEEEEEEGGIKSPDSPASSPSTVGGSDSEDSDSDDEEPTSRAKSGASSTATKSLVAPSTIASSRPTTLGASNSLASTLPALTVGITSQTSSTAMPQTTGTTLSTRVRSTVTSTITQDTSQSERQKQATATASVPSQSSQPTVEPDMSGDDDKPQESFPQREQHSIMTRSGAVAATTLGILGAIALLIGAVVLFKRRKRKQSNYNQPLPGDAFNSSNTDSLHAPETAHVGSASSIFGRLNGGGSGGNPHLTRSTDSSNTLFGRGTYERPETISTEHESRTPFAAALPTPLAPAIPTPNPFNDPPRNKAYDVLNNRPRSTTLTDRGSWVKNPFKDPESDRFDPFGELKEKARQERRRYVEEARREAERERQRQLEMKEKMGLGPADPAIH